jgi:hypothetical protein
MWGLGISFVLGFLIAWRMRGKFDEFDQEFKNYPPKEEH